ncbi:GNAT family N-acetyltransferase [Aegicerativicinus sediminis]
MGKDSALSFKLIEPKETYLVRHPILRKGRSLESCAMEGDDDETTLHIGAYFKNQLIGVMSLMNKNNPNFDEMGQFQLRGMAILEPYQCKGYGEELVNFGENLLNEKYKQPFIWLNAREGAKNFYLKLGYQLIGEPFNIDPIGIHYLMIKSL